MRIVAAFVLLAVLGGLAMFLTFSSSWGALLAPQARAEPTAIVEEAATPTPDWTGKLTATVSQAVVLRSAPIPAAPVVGMLRRGDTVALTGCDAEVLWCQTEDESWLLAYMLDILPADLPILDHPGLTIKTIKDALTPTPEPFTPPPATPTPAGQSLALLLPTPTPTTVPAYIETTVNEVANLRAGPGTDFAIIGKATPGDIVQVAGQNASGEWYQLADGAWIAAFLVEPPIAPPPVVAPDAATPADDLSLKDANDTPPVTSEAPAVNTPEEASDAGSDATPVQAPVSS
ncbi:MAG TPA: hypothetical protein DCL15_13665 [Chloroflexi bacterium]|nr:hypothetical protein [Chloroflexota bacterium]HHW87387.1 SH3 domain-containing protein [Chloroflexota bacterium]